MKKQIIEKIYRVVVYLRLSSDDGDCQESDSISNQRILIYDYLNEKPEFSVVKECVDDGFTGTNFSRPGFQEMMKLIEDGEADCIIVKDLSRFGRDFSGVLQYVERILPKMGVRLILVNDNYDSIFPNRDFLTLRLKSFINDIYPADTSKSVRANLYAKMIHGQCVAPFAAYGFLKSPEDKHKLIIDPVAGAVVQDIFHLKLKGHSLNEIADILNVRGILPPLVYKRVYLKQDLHTGFKLNSNSKWEATMVRRILLDERYTGVLIQGKRTTPNHKVKKVIQKSEDEWVRCENTIEPLVSTHVYKVVQHLMKHDTRKSLNGLALLSGLVECADCHQSMIRKSPNRTNFYYICSTSLYEKECQPHSFSEKKLIEIVKDSILYYISLMVELDKTLQYVKTISLPESKMYAADQQMKVLEEECARLLDIKKKLYDSYCEGLLDEEEFIAFKKKYNETLKQTEDTIKRQRTEISNMLSTLEKHQEWMRHFLIYKDANEIDRIMVATLVKRILVHSGKRISIEFWYSDEYERVVSLLHMVNNIQPGYPLTSFFDVKGGIKDAQNK
ncbi:recombinase family protein [Blautia hominis]|uniref:Recombinase family protein n=1 Tax=Blautia hominis TaxID=2025493 RepID=A0ABQ0BFR6_9FIRM